MSDLAAVVLALATAAGAWAARPVPLWAGVVAAAVAFALRRPALLWLGAAGWGASGLGFGSVCMLAVMVESDAAGIGRASGLVVLGFGAGSTIAPPLFGLLVDHGPGYGAGLALVAAAYVAAGLLMAAGRPHFGSAR
jgi:hypothetical protein